MSLPSQPTVIIYQPASRDWLYFEHPHRVLTVAEPGEVLPALAEIERLVERNHWHAAGFVSYDAAPGLDGALTARRADDFPLVWFGLYPPPRRAPLPPQPAQPAYHLGVWRPSVSAAAYRRSIARIKRHIARGDTYQVNYTFRLRTRIDGDPVALLAGMIDNQPGGYPALIDTGAHVICCASPELFFRLDGEQVTCRPMKGTAPRGRTTAEDRQQSAWLRSSEKNRAENVMIVDMLRNDLGRVAETGSVRVSRLFEVERYRTLWQMTSTVSAVVKAPFAQLFAALFPSASITGAPKIGTMRLIAALEATPRRLYTGTIGFLAPGRQAQFNVAIRTAILDHDARTAEYGVGGGVVWDSTPDGEYTEALLKARIVTHPSRQFALLETLRWDPARGYFLLDQHLQRLRDSAHYFDYPYDDTAIRGRLAETAKGLPPQPQRVRLALGRDAALEIATAPLPNSRETRAVPVAVSAHPVDTRDALLFHKTTHREVYDRARREHPQAGDVLLVNARGELTESTIANLVVELDGERFTPPVACGLLAGTFRAMLLEHGLVKERVIRIEELPRCARLFLVNSVRGWMDAELL